MLDLFNPSPTSLNERVIGTRHVGSGFLKKNVQTLARTAREHGQTLRVLEVAEALKHEERHALGNKVFAKFGGSLAGETFVLLGLTFKPNNYTDCLAG